ncbi:MAG: methyltransferase domain-containing protein [Eubacteriales bacterium]|nr:methyltransferase domain-containing protein [Eubacteriales bacterium]
MKIAAFQQKLLPALSLLRCPQCGAAFTIEGASLVCQNRHCFDLSTKGYINVAPGHHQEKEKYDGVLFDSRSRVLEGGFYVPIFHAIETMLGRRIAPFALADVGCGEGAYARALSPCFPDSLFFGLDLSREGILRAAKAGGNVHWLVADLKALPFAPHSLDVVLDVLTPADYTSFAKCLKEGGELIKVIPGSDYLKEIRLALKDQLREEEYSNQKVLNHLKEHCEILEHTVIRQTFPLEHEQSQAFLRMTPMTFSIAEEKLNQIELSAITIHMEVLRCKVLPNYSASN